MPWGDQASSRWEGSACVQIADEPKKVGEPCTAPMGGFGGVDDCGPTAMCWGVDQSTNQGYCVDLCMGTTDAPTCADPMKDCVRRDGVVNVCSPQCDPLAQDCPAGNVCVANTTRRFVCAADLSGRGGFLSDKAGASCVSYPSGAPHPGYENVGACLLP